MIARWAGRSLFLAHVTYLIGVGQRRCPVELLPGIQATISNLVGPTCGVNELKKQASGVATALCSALLTVCNVVFQSTARCFYTKLTGATQRVVASWASNVLTNRALDVAGKS